MPRYKCFFLFFSFFTAMCFSVPGQTADWPACEKAKLKQLNIEQSSRAGQRGAKKSRANSSRSRRSAEQIEEWLWRNCRDYSYELRNLEQQRM